MVTGEFADAVAALAQATNRVLQLWESEGLEPDEYNPANGYPYSDSLDDVAASVSHWADLVRLDASPAGTVWADVKGSTEALKRACEGCNAEPGEPCRPGCLSGE